MPTTSIEYDISVPFDYDPIAFRSPKPGELFVNQSGMVCLLPDGGRPDPSGPRLIVKRKPPRMVGTAHWCGTLQGDPAVLLSYHGGCTVWAFRNSEWVPDRKFSDIKNQVYSRHEAEKYVGIR